MGDNHDQIAQAPKSLNLHVCLSERARSLSCEPLCEHSLTFDWASSFGPPPARIQQVVARLFVLSFRSLSKHLSVFTIRCRTISMCRDRLFAALIHSFALKVRLARLLQDVRRLAPLKVDCFRRKLKQTPDWVVSPAGLCLEPLFFEREPS